MKRKPKYKNRTPSAEPEYKPGETWGKAPNQPRFKVGDRVRIARGECYLGSLATIVHDFTDEVYEIKIDGWRKETTFYGENLEPAKVPDGHDGTQVECDIDQLPYPYNIPLSDMPKQVNGIPIWINGRFVKVNINLEKKTVDIACYACGHVVKSFSLEGV